MLATANRGTRLARLVLALTLVCGAAGNAAGQGSYLGANFTTCTYAESLFYPPDTMGAVGPNHVMIVNNGRYGVYRKDSDGTPIAGLAGSLNAFWTSAGIASYSNYAFDPRIAYDPTSRRWYVSSVDGARNTNNAYLFAVSKTSNPEDGFTGFRFSGDPTGNTWADFDTLGFDGANVYIAANMVVNNGMPGLPTGNIQVLPKADLLAATPTIANKTVLSVTPWTWQATQAVDGLGPDQRPYRLWQQESSSPNVLKLTQSAGSFNTPTTETFSISPSMDQGSLAWQPDGVSNNRLHMDNLRVSSAVTRIGDSYWMVYPRRDAGNTQNVIRWIEFDATTSGAPTVNQQGTITVPGLMDAIYPSIALNAEGDVVVGFTASGKSAGQYASGYAAVGRTVGGVTTFDTPFAVKSGTSNYLRLDGSGRNRWGDYSATGCDPADPNIFWTFQEWAAEATTWATQASEIIVAGANENYWKTAASGSFTDSSQWTAAAQPSASDHVFLSRPGSPFTVTLAADAANQRLSVRQGSPTLSIAPGKTYTLTSASTTATSLTVSEFAGTSALTITGGGTLQTVHAAIGGGAGSAASVTLSGAGTQWLNSGSLYLGGSATAAGAPASLSVAGDTALIVGGLLRAYGAATTIQTAGLLRAASVQIDGNLDVLAGGRLEAAGTIGGRLDDLGTLAPGQSPGTLTAGQLVLHPQSVLELELGQANVTGGPLNDLLRSLGDLTLDGTVNVIGLAGFGPGRYTLIDYDGTLNDFGLELGTLPAGYWGYIVVDQANTEVDLYVVPESGTLALLAMGMFGALAIWRLRRR